MKHLLQKNPQKHNSRLITLFLGVLSMKYLLTHFQDEIKSVLILTHSTEIKPLHCRSPVSDMHFLKEFHSLLFFQHSQYVERV